MNVTETIRTIAKQFQSDNNLDDTDIPAMLQHDFIHATLGLGVSQSEEELVGYIELHLDHGATWNTEAVRLAATLPQWFRDLYRFG